MPRRKGDKPGTKHGACRCPQERAAKLKPRSCDTQGCSWRVEERDRSRSRLKNGKVVKGTKYKGGKRMYVVTNGVAEKWIGQECLAKSIQCDLCADERSGR